MTRVRRPLAPRWFPARLFAALLALACLASGAGVARAADMAFSIAPLADPETCRHKCVDVILADGEIVDSTPEELLEFLAKHLRDDRLRTVVFLNSPGGKVVASMRLGQVLRKVGAMAVVARVVPPEPGSGQNAAFASARCYSACVYALMGAKKRVAPPQSSVGIHRMFNIISGRDPSGFVDGPQRVYDAGLLGSKLESYAASMGVSPDLV
eukprot:gene37143-44470_t